MTTTTRKGDHLGRSLVNPSLGSSDATDFLGRSVGPSNTDFLGRSLFPPAVPFAVSTAYQVDDVVYLPGGEELTCTVAGTTGRSLPAVPEAVGDTVTNATTTWQRTR